MKQLDLFAGVGGISLAAEWAGIETVAFCEKEPFAQDILRRRFPGRPIYNDVFDLTKEALENDNIHEVDIVAGGFPCQPFSYAGKRTGTTDDRYLWPEMCRIISEVRPSWVFAENVDGLVSMAQSDGEPILEDETTICTETEMVLETIRKDLEAIGYKSIPVIIPACSIGASHRRYRIFILGYTERGGCCRKSWGGTGQESSNRYIKSEEGIVANTSGKQNRRRKQYRIQPDIGASSQTVADSSGGGCTEAREHSERSTERITGCGSVAHTNIYYPRGLSFGKRQEDSRTTISSEDVVNTTGQRLSEPTRLSSRKTTSTRPQYRSVLGIRETRRGTTESGMGRGPYELSDWLDGWGMNPLDALINFIMAYPQPALMGQEQYSWEPPRVATGVKNRTARLKALGNAVDPLQAFPVLYGIRVIHEFLMEGGNLELEYNL